MKLDFNKIISNSLTVLVATVFVGAAAQLWNGVQGIDQRIADNLVEIKATQKVLAPKVDEIASACLFLITDECGFMTGQTLHINGGPDFF